MQDVPRGRDAPSEKVYTWQPADVPTMLRASAPLVEMHVLALSNLATNSVVVQSVYVICSERRRELGALAQRTVGYATAETLTASAAGRKAAKAAAATANFIVTLAEWGWKWMGITRSACAALYSYWVFHHPLPVANRYDARRDRPELHGIHCLRQMHHDLRTAHEHPKDVLALSSRSPCLCLIRVDRANISSPAVPGQ